MRASVSSSVTGSGATWTKSPACAAWRLPRVDAHPQVDDGAVGRMGFQIELQQFEERLGIERGDRQAQTAFVSTAGLQFETQAEFVGGQAARGQTRGLSVDQARQQEGERLQQFDGVIELDGVFKMERIGERKQLAVAFAAGEFAEAQSFPSEPFGDAERRECRHFVEAAYAPALQGFEQLGSRR